MRKRKEGRKEKRNATYISNWIVNWKFIDFLGNIKERCILHGGLVDDTDSSVKIITILNISAALSIC